VSGRHPTHPVQTSLIAEDTGPDRTHGVMSMEGIFGKPQERKSERADGERTSPTGEESGAGSRDGSLVWSTLRTASAVQKGCL